MKPSGIITLTTDFGYRDPFVGQMKGVMLKVHPQAVIVDLTHGIGSHDIEDGGFAIATSCVCFPDGTIHVAVVDPGVGSQRRGVIVQAGKHFFIGPDNGIFSRIILEAGTYQAVHLVNERFFLPNGGPTFHGRDVFAPAAAWLAKGKDMRQFGPAVDDLFLSDIPQPALNREGLSGQVIYIDKFGNAITNIMKGIFDNDKNILIGWEWKDGALPVPMVPHYAAAKGDTLHALFNSSGYLELFVNQKSASALHGIRKGDKVSISLSPFLDKPLSAC